MTFPFPFPLDPTQPSPWNPPDWNVPENPTGYGEPHPPSGGFSVDAKELLDASKVWDDVAGTLKTVWDGIQEGWGYPGLFGKYDMLQVSGTLHMHLNQALVNAAADGHWITQGLADGLVEVANDFEDTDTTQGENFRSLRKRA
ncbi:hypothetical protein [Nocardioides flavescens]|uniref:Excreted virulence factor EspC, type VII ESX diderm n=1 Tax=Nocardioides flavescens TaxID=2691959 RepID=A0A6L7EZG5_9ACTN|nr:hypothetical protein [Nocardioides flavescens]MXG91158.1 hypothetical protein [Nocardioides flavescens]